MEYYIITIVIAAVAWAVGVRMGSHYTVKRLMEEMDK
jgi:hypothetical protein